MGGEQWARHMFTFLFFPLTFPYFPSGKLLFFVGAITITVLLLLHLYYSFLERIGHYTISHCITIIFSVAYFLSFFIRIHELNNNCWLFVRNVMSLYKYCSLSSAVKNKIKREKNREMNMWTVRYDDELGRLIWHL